MQEKLRSLDTAQESPQQLTTELDILLGQISDPNLHGLIEALREETTQEQMRTMPILRLLQNPDKLHIDGLEAGFKEYASILRRLRRKLIPTNKPMQESLCRDEAA